MKFNDTSFKFIIRPSKINNEGHIHLRKIKNRKKTYESLRLPRLKIKYWNESTQRVRKSNQIDYKLYNNKIEAKLKEIKSSHGPLDPSKRASLVHFFNHYLKSTSLNPGTKSKYFTILKKLKSFRDSENYSDIKFKDFNVAMISSFFEFMRNNGLEQNTCRNYLKVVNSVVRKAQKTEGYYNVPNHFINYKYPKQLNKIKEVLSKDEIQKIISFETVKKEIEKTRSMFLFQLFSKGMRVSDLLLLRFNNLTSGHLKYTMFKTKNSMFMKLLPIHFELLEPFVCFETKVDDVFLNYEKKQRLRYKSIRNKFNDWSPPREDGKPQDRLFKRINPLKYAPIYIEVFEEIKPVLHGKYYVDSYQEILCSMNLEEIKNELIKLESFKRERGYSKIGNNSKVEISKEIFFKTQKFLPHVIKDVKSKIDKLEKKYFNKKREELEELATNPHTKNQFLFDYLPNEDFSNIGQKNDFSRISEKQYSRINKKSIVYNRQLKKLQKEVGISKNDTIPLSV
ncbi:phage integrase SAM-like domain-containing protein [Marixanthomonas spongiae]|uniref:Core-binding (CB) domain-containing protein n=1 Tax=Marixanthomonas spongiae TaxID=2174845 RepID=A0A2U0HZ25_9FLAO|nr:phage integrase SAM-like domain-containing protein [Marixanthomonas spongiae]PVW14088.1 hypothetical protein DDV96_09715 [Marixanthomonas spongiae]